MNKDQTLAKPNFLLNFSIIFTTLLVGLFSRSIHASPLFVNVTTDWSNVQQSEQSNVDSLRSLFILGYEEEVIDGWKVYADVAWFTGNNGSAELGDIQGYSNIDAEEFKQFNEVWIETGWMDGMFRTKVGQMDANSDFAVASHASSFLNSSMGYSPTVLTIPTYPDPRLGVVVFAPISGNQSAAVAVFFDESDSLENQYALAEYQLGNEYFSTKLGVWHYSGPLQRFDRNETQDAGRGYYMVAEGDVSAQWLNASSLGWYLQAGYTDQRVSALSHHLGGGVVLYDPFNIESSRLGLAVTRVDTSAYLSEQLQPRETVFEIFYSKPVTQNFVVQPDLQYIRNPGLNQALDDALVFTLRTIITF